MPPLRLLTRSGWVVLIPVSSTATFTGSAVLDAQTRSAFPPRTQYTPHDISCAGCGGTGGTGLPRAWTTRSGSTYLTPEIPATACAAAWDGRETATPSTMG